MTDQPKTATIPMELLEAYVALQREVQECMEPEDEELARLFIDAYGFAHPEFQLDEARVRAALAVVRGNS